MMENWSNASFPLFCRLPLEIRTMIWNHVLPPPHHQSLDISDSIYLQHGDHEYNAERLRCSRAALGTCVESRTLFMKQHAVFSRRKALVSGIAQSFTRIYGIPFTEPSTPQCAEYIGRPNVVQRCRDTYFVSHGLGWNTRMRIYIDGIEELVPGLLSSIRTVEAREVDWMDPNLFPSRDDDDDDSHGWQLWWLVRLSGLQNVCFTGCRINLKEWDGKEGFLTKVEKHLRMRMTGESRSLNVTIRDWQPLQLDVPFNFDAVSHSVRTFQVGKPETAVG
ncbi:uncharacterized protein LY89DRAFT_130409 [Mollisia scopiformis]|uniref:2EXR domain-containing protein n=1 Tax=Mollisia scopiformis TaxID=149040 RepID=A0A194X1R7_MOLSC|nr:uncharacterized protein LY89DRAFT_130409 [Mollisia scopiformis]KUJ14141.1 hypothetical protein LY89DRAFT_130409 [Mollisia scopiformis]